MNKASFMSTRGSPLEEDPRAGRLELQGISKRFGNSELAALENITLDCRPGEFVVVVGPSGCGKSTLLNIAAGMTKPDRGAAGWMER